MRLLAVDDDPVVLNLLNLSLTQCGYKDVVFVESAHAALEQVRKAKKPFDCFLLDIMMPEIDGIELCQRLRRLPQYAASPIIMITACREHDIMGRAFRAGATDFVSKPFDGLELGSRVNIAAMLSDSLRREKVARQEMADFAELTAIAFDEAVSIKTAPFVTSLGGLLASLEKKGDAYYAMSLLSVEIQQAEALFQSMTSTQFRQAVESVGFCLSTVFNPDHTRFAYVGQGRFAAVNFGREEIDLNSTRERAEMALCKGWPTGRFEAPRLSVEPIDTRYLWTGRAAAARVKRYVEMQDVSALKTLATL